MFGNKAVAKYVIKQVEMHYFDQMQDQGLVF